ncbi:disease resistance protein RGA3 [Artemisia annua]|uniref:Disease resistance protein RGA3 n=1 Tax=Artemisia annua TaxID=35608 RepID=A0A2U1NXB7_ARTAN|nr:disease resistance protein RGA3 [Artemisia annua]
MVDAFSNCGCLGNAKKALSIATNEVALALGYKDKLTEFHKTVNMIRAKLSGADGKKSTGVVMEWLKQLKRVVDEADDVLDEVHYEILRREVKKRYRGDVARKIRCFPNLKKFSFGRDMGHKIENINKGLSQIYERAKNLRLQDEQIEPAGNIYRQGTVPFFDEFKIVGSENDELRLAKVDTLLADIYESLAGKKFKSITRVNLIRNLQEKLGSKRYLLVLDDVWDEELAYWDEFRRCILQVLSDNGSGIIVTTQKLNIGRNATFGDSYSLERLSYDDSWAMFKERALPMPEFETIERDIDEDIRREELVQLWMALGLVHTDTKTNKEMEDVGNDIFQILVNNSLFQNVKMDQYGDSYGCQMHDLVHDLLSSLSSHEISHLVVSDDVHIPAVKHLALQPRGYKNSVFDIFKEDMTARTLQTLLEVLRSNSTLIMF